MDVENILNNARSLTEQGKKDEAQMCLLAVLKEQPDNIAALLMLGGSYFVDNNFREAKIVFERLVDLEPEVGQYSIETQSPGHVLSIDRQRASRQGGTAQRRLVYTIAAVGQSLAVSFIFFAIG